MDAHIDRFLSKIKKQPNGCWDWIGAKTSGGYGHLTSNGRNVYAHRMAFQYWRGSIAAGLEIDHLCRNKACVNPAHLEAVTPKINSQRSNSVSGKNFRKDRCPNCGGEYTPEGKGRRCKSCHRKTALANYYRKQSDAGRRGANG